MFEDQTFDNILNRMLGELSNEIDKREGSVAYDMLAPKAAELAQAYIELDNVLDFGFADTTYGKFLDMKVSEAGVQRLDPIKAQGTVTVTGPEDLVIEKGTVVSTNGGIEFVTTEQDTILGGDAVINIEAVEPGAQGNVPANSIININIENVNVTNEQVTTGGNDEETDEQLLSRYYKKVQAPGVSGNKQHYIEWAIEIPGIGDARVIPLWNGNGTVKVILMSVDKDIVAPEKVQEVYDFIETVRPVGAVVTVESAVRKYMDVNATLTLSEGFTLSQVEPEVNNMLESYYEDAAFNDGDIKYSRIGNILLSVDGVLDYTNLTLNGGISNVNLNINEIPSSGNVVLS